ncbi:MAG: YeeE/YedE family protein [Bacteroidetes bacterium]|nr:YeeE/YedE family protein [Bacteroidota bacterium]
MSAPKAYMNPYFSGFLLGLVLLTTIYITGRGLGASGGVKAVVQYGVEQIAPEHYNSTEYYVNFKENNPGSPLQNWLFYEIIGVLVGAFFSGVLGNRVALKLEKGPGVQNKTRLIFAVLGGAFFGFGSQLGRGCTSGSALSGMGVMSFGGIMTMFAIFGGAYFFAWFFRKLWINKVN